MGIPCSLVSQNSPNFMGLTKHCPGVTQNSVQDTKCSSSFLSHKNITFLIIDTKYFDFPTVGENIYRSRTAIKQERKTFWEDKVRKRRFYYLEVVLRGG